MGIWWKSILADLTERFMNNANDDFRSMCHLFCDRMILEKYELLMDQLDDAGVPMQRSCQECTSYFEDREDGDYGVCYSCEPGCRRFPGYANLTSFPFQNAQKLKCFVLDFWNSKYGSLMSGNEEQDDLYWEKWRKEYLLEPVKA
jgi:hypothetical protein